MRRALITGITGQDGSYLAEHLLARGYEVWGLMHRHANPQTQDILREVRMIRGDLLAKDSLVSAIERAEPDEVYNLAAISYVPLSWQQAEFTARVTGHGAVHVLEAVRQVSGITASRSPGRGQIRFFQASSAQQFGSAEWPQNEMSPLSPCTPHGSAKAYAFLMTQTYRETYGMFAVSGILFNHESPRRAADFVSRKVSLGVARIKLGYEQKIRLGRLSTRRDWGYAGDYVRAMHLMLTQDEPKDYIIGTGTSRTVEELVSQAFSAAGLDWRNHVVSDTAFIRPCEPRSLCADPAKAEGCLSWVPEVTFDELLNRMVEADLRLLSSPDAEIYHIPEPDSL
jgi:GDPmannose 4,6-dehydratase